MATTPTTQDQDFFTGLLDWATNNPQLASSIVAGIGTLVDPAQPAATTQTQQTKLPDYIAPYVGRVLNQAESLAQTPYQEYTGQRLADFNQDQLAAFQRWREMNPTTPTQDQGAGIVGQAASQLLGAGGQRWDQAAANHYMSPYMQSVVDIQKREAQRDFDKYAPTIDAEAARAGAFGGDRHGLVEAEARRNLDQRLSDIQLQGQQSAYTNAQGQFNADMNRQGTLLTGAAGAGQTLAGIGQNQFQNQLAVNQGLMGIGTQQQGLEQKSMDTGYQDFLRQQQYPYEQLNYMRTAYQGLPMTQYTTANVTSAPTMTQQLVGNMAAGYGIGGYAPTTTKTGG